MALYRITVSICPPGRCTSTRVQMNWTQRAALRHHGRLEHRGHSPPDLRMMLANVLRRLLRRKELHREELRGVRLGRVDANRHRVRLRDPPLRNAHRERPEPQRRPLRERGGQPTVQCRSERSPRRISRRGHVTPQRLTTSPRRTLCADWILEPIVNGANAGQSAYSAALSRTHATSGTRVIIALAVRHRIVLWACDRTPALAIARTRSDQGLWSLAHDDPDVDPSHCRL